VSAPKVPTREVPILIVGAGGCGLTASLLLSDLGIDALVVERHPGTSLLAKAHILNPRTMEIFDHLGIADEVFAAGAPAANYESTRWYTSLGGEDPWDCRCINRVDSWSGGALEPYYKTLSAFRHGNVPQKILEPILRRHAEERNPGRVLFGHELVSLTPDEDGVAATILNRDTGETYIIRAGYVIGADGGKTVGAAVGAQMVGPAPFVDQISIHMRADLSEHLLDDDSQIRLFVRPTVDGDWVQFGMVAMGPTQFDRHCEEWHVAITLPIGMRTERLAYDEAQAREDIRALLKLPDLEFEILNITHWLVEGVHADHVQFGRVFLAGDAAHRHSPMGGLGLNTAIQDAHNLCWKLSAILKGRAAPALASSYEPERLPVGIRNVEFATFSFFNHLGARASFGLLPGAPPEHNRAALETLFSDTPDGAIRRLRMQEIFRTLRFEFEAADIELGYEYGASSAVVSDGSEAPARDAAGHLYLQSARPGHRMPHSWLTRDGRDVATHALIKSGAFLLLAGEHGDPWISAAQALGHTDNVEVNAWLAGPGAELDDRDGSWSTLRGHGPDGAILVRPDGHVAYRAIDRVPDPEHELSAALDVALGRAPSTTRS
jgi:2,4-dichlorophenol 6-monooxygenase